LLPRGAPHRVRLGTRLRAWSIVLVTTTVLPVVLFVDLRMGGLLRKQSESRGLSIARSLAALSQPALAVYDYLDLARAAERARSDEEGIIEVIILDKEGHVAAYSHPEHLATVLDDPVSLGMLAATGEVVVPVMLRRDDTSAPERGLDIAVPVHVAMSPEKWGTVRIRLSTEGVYRTIRDTRLALLGLALLALGGGVLGSHLLARRITDPLSRLVEATAGAATGDALPIEIWTGDEIEDLARIFNETLQKLRDHRRAIEDLNRSLEEKVRGRTTDLLKANQALRTAYDERKQAEGQLLLSEKMASLGRLVAGVAHEINTPASAIGAAIGNVTADLGTLSRHIPLLGSALPDCVQEPYYALVADALGAGVQTRRPSTAEIRLRSRELEQSLGALGIDGARELALAFSRLGLDEPLLQLAARLAESPAICSEFLGSVGSLAVAVNDIRLSTEAIRRMVKALKGYSHLDQAERAECDVHDGLETTLAILRNQVRYGVIVERRYGRLPPVTGNTSELNQVWTNLIHNAVQAMKGVGTLTIETGLQEEFIAVRISDTGPGIAPEVLPRIFDPFFTTKPQGDGAGLGLGICHQIIRRHDGRIGVSSEPGRTTFEVLLPIVPRPAEVRT
jgi:signal transduction histidine kinase